MDFRHQVIAYAGRTRNKPAGFSYWLISLAVVHQFRPTQVKLEFYLSPDRVFIPLKMRQPQAEYDPVYGYVDLNFIAHIEQTPDHRCRLTLTNGITVDLFCTRDTAIKSRECGARLLESLQDKNASTDLEGLVLGAVTGLIQMMIQMHQDLTRINRRLQALLPDDVEESRNPIRSLRPF